MWMRVGAALLVTTLAAFGCLEYLGVSSVLGRAPSEVQQAAYGRTREFFWFLVFSIVMATSLLAAAHRWIDSLRRVAARSRR